VSVHPTHAQYHIDALAISNNEIGSIQFSCEVERSIHNQLLGDNPSSWSTNHISCLDRFNCQLMSLSACLANEIMSGSSIKYNDNWVTIEGKGTRED
jgi:hypothetical protein